MILVHKHLNNNLKQENPLDLEVHSQFWSATLVLVAYDPEIKLKTFSIIFDDPEGRGGPRPFFRKILN